MNKKEHWENIYKNKAMTEVGWFEPSPELPLTYIQKNEIGVDKKIIDIGGGDSLWTEQLLEKGYNQITVMDISPSVIQRAKVRMGTKKADKITWIVQDILDFQSLEKYDFWYDRAAFHFLTEVSEIAKYVEIAASHMNIEGTLVVGTFSIDGPTKCSGIAIKQYDEKTLEEAFLNHFDKVNCTRVDHQTPSGSTQNFVFCEFKRK